MAVEKLRLPMASAARKRRAEYPGIHAQLDALWTRAEAEGLVADAGAEAGSAAEVLARRKVVDAKYPDSA